MLEISLVTLHIQTQFTSTGGLNGTQEAAMPKKHTIFMPNNSVIIISYLFFLELSVARCLMFGVMDLATLTSSKMFKAAQHGSKQCTDCSEAIQNNLKATDEPIACCLR